MSEAELILAKLKIVSETEERGMYLCDKEHSKLLLDYITNLQEENERLTRSLVCYDETLLKRNNEYEDYKSRNEKAIGYIRKQTHDEDTGNYLGYPDLIDDEHLLNILQGSDDK